MTISFLVWLLAFFIQLGLLGIAMYGVRLRKRPHFSALPLSASPSGRLPVHD
jgi:hypothetical protein